MFAMNHMMKDVKIASLSPFFTFFDGEGIIQCHGNAFSLKFGEE